MAKNTSFYKTVFVLLTNLFYILKSTGSFKCMDVNIFITTVKAF